MEKRLQKIICKIVNLDENEVFFFEDLNLQENLGYDSIKFIQLIVEIEQEFDIFIDDQYLEIERLGIYNNLINLIENLIQNH